MRFVPFLTLMALCLGLFGCATFGKKPTGQQPTNRNGGPERNQAVPTDRIGAVPGPDRSAPPPGVGGLLAGQVIDSYNRRPPAATYIQVSESQEAGGPPGAPIEVATDNQGYFTIQGLQAGKHYRLTARTKAGERLLAGTTWATPPDPKILIRISEDFATTSTPAIPAAPAWPGASQPPGSQSSGTPTLNGPTQPTAPSDQAWAPGHGVPSNSTGPRRAADLGAPVGIAPVPGGQRPPTLPSFPAASNPENIAEGNRLATNLSPEVKIPSQEMRTPPPVVSTGPALVPSCVLTGQSLHNFALYDLNGRPWEYRHDHRGRLVLIDFWGTWCVHCLHVVPHLNILQQRYGRYGLEVVGVAYEEGSPQERVQKVNRVRQRLEINYRLLMGSDRNTCPVRTQFAVVNWPTLVLLDETGRIIWRGEGHDNQQIRELENVVRQRLGVR